MSEAAVAIIHARQPEDSVLFMRRAEREGDSWSGHWSFPGGRRSPGDRDLLDTALRELEEECGIRLSREQMEMALPQTIARRKAPPFIQVAPFVFLVEAHLPTVLDPREAAGAAWVPLRLLRDPGVHKLRAVPRRPREMLFPAVDLEGLPLWGFTYRLTTFWLGLDPKCEPVERAGAEAADVVLAFLLANGLTFEHSWDRRTATVKGVIPVDRVLDHFSAPARCLPGVNCLEVRPDHVRVVGMAWEDHWIRTV